MNGLGHALADACTMHGEAMVGACAEALRQTGSCLPMFVALDRGAGVVAAGLFPGTEDDDAQVAAYEALAAFLRLVPAAVVVTVQDTFVSYAPAAGGVRPREDPCAGEALTVEVISRDGVLSPALNVRHGRSDTGQAWFGPLEERTVFRYGRLAETLVSALAEAPPLTRGARSSADTGAAVAHLTSAGFSLIGGA